MAYKTPLQTLKDEQDFYKGLENSFILAPEVLQQASSEFEGYDINLIQKQIMESPSDVQLDRLMRGKLYEDFIFIFLYQALAQALQYNSQNDLTIIDMDDIPNMYFLDDVDVLYDELKTIPQVGREKLFNHYSNVNPNSLALYKKAIMELDKDSLVRIIEIQEVDIVWMQKLLGYLHYNKSINDRVFNGEISWDDSSILVRKILNELPNDDKEPDPYFVEWRANQKKLCDAAQNSEPGEELPDDFLSVMASLYLKSYWFGCSEYDVKSQQIIDNYINKPCFSEFVSKCRAEFEEEERIRTAENDSSESVVAEEEQEISLREDTTSNKANKGSWLKNPKEKYYEGRLGLDIKDNVWPWVHDRVCQLQYDSLKGTNRKTKIKYTCAILIHQAALSLGYANSLSDNAASSFEKVMKFENITRQTLKKYDEMMEAYYIKKEMDNDDFSNDHDGSYFDYEANTTIYHGTKERNNSDFIARQPDLALFLAKNFDAIPGILYGTKTKLRVLLSNYI